MTIDINARKYEKNKRWCNVQDEMCTCITVHDALETSDQTNLYCWAMCCLRRYYNKGKITELLVGDSRIANFDSMNSRNDTNIFHII